MILDNVASVLLPFGALKLNFLFFCKKNKKQSCICPIALRGIETKWTHHKDSNAASCICPIPFGALKHKRVQIISSPQSVTVASVLLSFGALKHITIAVRSASVKQSCHVASVLLPFGALKSLSLWERWRAQRDGAGNRVRFVSI